MLGARAALRTFEAPGETALDLCQQALALYSPENAPFRAQNLRSQMNIFYTTALNDAPAAIERGRQAIALAQAAGLTSLALGLVGTMAQYMLGTGRLHEIHRLAQQARQMGMQDGGGLLPDGGYPAFYQAKVLRKWNQLDAALPLAEEALGLCEQNTSLISLGYLLLGYAVLLRVALSRGELERARLAHQQFEYLGRSTNQPMYRFTHSHFTASDQVRLWLACGERDRATRWAEQLQVETQPLNPFVREREDVACARVWLAQQQPTLALQRLEPALQRATQGQRWSHVIEIHLLQALASQMLQQEQQALDTLTEAVRLAEPEGYLRTFVDEGPSMQALLYRLRKPCAKHEPTPYLDTLLTAFQQESKACRPDEAVTKAQSLPEPLSERELEVLQLLAQGRSNQEIAHELVITIDTVKRHVSHIFAKLGVTNRVQAIKQAYDLGLLDTLS